MPRPRVFVSSVMDGFEEYREAARQGIEAADAEPVLVEDYTALAASPRNACLDGVASSDICIVILGDRVGWTAPSGKLVVEEEYEEALRRNLRILAFVQEDVKRDDDAERLVQIVSDYVSGVFRPTFNTPPKLERAVTQALTAHVNYHQNPVTDVNTIQQRLAHFSPLHNEATLRVILAPERIEEIIDPVTLESDDLKRQIMEIGHAPGVALLSYERSKSTSVGINEIVIIQTDGGRAANGMDEVRLEINTQGLLSIDVNVTGREPRDFHTTTFSGMVVVESDIEIGLRKAFAFAKVFFDARDPYHRYSRLLYNAALAGTQYKQLVAEPPTGSSISVPMHRTQGEIIDAFDQARLILRSDLERSETQIAAVLSLFRRRMNRQF